MGIRTRYRGRSLVPSILPLHSEAIARKLERRRRGHPVPVSDAHTVGVQALVAARLLVPLETDL